MSDDKISEAAKRYVAQKLAKSIERQFFDAMSCNVEPQDQEPLDVEKVLDDWGKMLRQIRRDQITFVVDIAHEGSPLQHETPCDGKRIEMSWHQANELHQHWPIRLSKVLSPEQAEFVPIGGVFPEFVTRVLPMPPFEMPEEQSET